MLEQLNKDIERLGIDSAKRAEYEQKAEAGETESQYELALLLFKDGELDNAEKWFKTAAKQEHSGAKAYLGLMYSSLLYWQDHINNDKAFELVQQAAKQNDPLGQYLYGIFNELGLGTEPNILVAKDYYEKAVKNGIDVAYARLGDLYRTVQFPGISQGESYKKALEYFRICVEKDILEGKYNLAYMYWNGTGVEKDMKMAVQLLNEVANEDFALADYALGCIYLYGEDGIKRDIEQAVMYFERGAMLGYSLCEFQMGAMYLEDDYFEFLPRAERNAKGVAYIDNAASKGLAEALYLMGTYYHEGRYVEQDNRTAWAYLNAAVQAGGVGGELAAEYLEQIK